MAEFLVVFVVTFLIILGVIAALVFGRTPVYRPDIEKVQGILTNLLDGQLLDSEWDFFISMPIHHDTELEEIRLKCFEITEMHGLRPKNQLVRLKEPGLIRVRHLLNRLEQAGSKSF